MPIKDACHTDGKVLDPEVTVRGEVEMLWRGWAEGPLRGTR